MKYGISGEDGIKELIDCVIIDLEMVKFNTLKTDPATIIHTKNI